MTEMVGEQGPEWVDITGSVVDAQIVPGRRRQWQCVSCDSLYRTWFERCPRCGGPGPEVDPPAVDGAGVEPGHGVALAPPPDNVSMVPGDAPVPGTGVTIIPRPPVNAPKATHIDHGVTRWGLDPAWLWTLPVRGDEGLANLLRALDDDEVMVTDQGRAVRRIGTGPVPGGVR